MGKLLIRYAIVYVSSKHENSLHLSNSKNWRISIKKQMQVKYIFLNVIFIRYFPLVSHNNLYIESNNGLENKKIFEYLNKSKFLDVNFKKV